MSVHAQDRVPPLTIPPYQSVPPQVAEPRLQLPSPPVVKRQTGYRTPRAGDVSVTIRADVLSAFVDRELVQSKNVSTQVMEANVRGVQTTATTVRFRSTASHEMAHLLIEASGNVSSNTVGYTPQAQVATLGKHQFLVTKPVFFDGRRFLTKPAYGSLQVRQQPRAMTTVASGIPLLGPIGERIAWNEYYRRQPISDSIVVRQVADEVVPQVNDGVDESLTELNRIWRQLRTQIDALPVGRALSWAASSTPQSFSLTVVNNSITDRTADPTKQLLPELADNEAVAIVLSEDGINHFMDRLPIAGRTYSDRALQNLVQSVMAAQDNVPAIQAALLDAATADAEPLAFSVRMSDRRPIGVYLENGLLTLRVKFQILPRVGEAGQMTTVRVSLGGEAGENGQWNVAIRDVGAEPANQSETADVWTTMITTQGPVLAKRLPPQTIPRRVDLRRFHEKLPVMRLHRIQTENAQLRISFNLEQPARPATAARPPVLE